MLLRIHAGMRGGVGAGAGAGCRARCRAAGFGRIRGSARAGFARLDLSRLALARLVLAGGGGASGFRLRSAFIALGRRMVRLLLRLLGSRRFRRVLLSILLVGRGAVGIRRSFLVGGALMRLRLV